MAMLGAERKRWIKLAAIAWSCASRRGIANSHHFRSTGRPSIVHKRGPDILHDPWFNKGTASPATERDRLGLRGLLPPRVMTPQQQIDRFMSDFKALERTTRDGPRDLSALAKWRILNRLHDRNETLYYKILIDNIKNFAPIIYTPTVGLVCQNYSGLFRRPRGMYFSSADRGEMLSMVYNWPGEHVDIIVVTDGSRILGLGDLGVQGVGIPIGKLDLYVAAAGFNPQRVLPVMLDVGTNNKKLLDDPLYLGLQQQRLDGEDYLAVVDEFMEAVFARWPHVIVQFEDFQSKWAFKLLQRYRNHYRMFNDDIQGTAGVALAGLFGAVRAQGKPLSELANAKIVVVGAGSAGLGVLHMTRKAIGQILGDKSKATRNLYLLDKMGLVTKERADADVDPDAKPFARSTDEGLREGASLLEVVKHVKPDMLVGLSGVGGIFSREVLREMKNATYKRPAIFPMSNPTMNAECTAEEAFTHVGDHIIFASGSPFDDVQLENGKIGHVNQGNNMYLFPGIGLGTLLCGAKTVTDKMLSSAAARLASYMGEDDVSNGKIYPPISSIRDISKQVAVAVVRAAVEEDIVEGFRDVSGKELKQMTEDATADYVEEYMWCPQYTPLIYEER